MLGIPQIAHRNIQSLSGARKCLPFFFRKKQQQQTKRQEIKCKFYKRHLVNQMNVCLNREPIDRASTSNLMDYNVNVLLELLQCIKHHTKMFMHSIQ